MSQHTRHEAEQPQQDLFLGGPTSAISPPRAAWRNRLKQLAAFSMERDLHYTLPFLCGLIALQLRPVLRHGGWPMNHEALYWKQRMLIYAAHILRFDLLPIWSDSAATGIGAPLPILYHKLFYMAAAPLYLLTGWVKVSVLVTVSGFTLLGVFGLRAVLTFFGVPRRAALVASAALAVCNYSYTDWIVRGALAEYSAMMLLPWLFRWLVGVLEGDDSAPLRRRGMLLFPALYLAHACLFYFAALPVIAAVAWRFAFGADRRAFFRAVCAIGGTFVAVALPIVVCQLYLVRGLNFAEGIGSLAPRNAMFPLSDYLTGGEYVWGRDWRGYSVALDMPLVAIAGIGLCQLVWTRVRHRGESARGGEARFPRVAYVACWLCVGYFGFLLSSWSLPLYEHVPGFSTLQFPWRLLSFTSLLSVILAAFPLSSEARWGRSNSSTALAWLLPVVTYACSPWLHEIRYEWFSKAELEAPAPPTAALLLGYFEYHPKVADVNGEAVIGYIERLRPDPTASSWHKAGYRVDRVDEPTFESGLRAYRIRASAPSTVVLPVVYSPFIHVEQVTNGERQRVTGYGVPSDPRIHVDLPTGEARLEVRMPTLLSFYRDLLTGHGR